MYFLGHLLSFIIKCPKDAHSELCGVISEFNGFIIKPENFETL